MIRGQILTRALGDPEYVSAMQRAALAFPQYRSQLPAIPYAYTRTRLIERPHFELWRCSGRPARLARSTITELPLLGADARGNARRRKLRARPRDPSRPAFRSRPSGTLTLKADDIDSRYGPTELHRVVNSSPESAYSLQLYANPITTYNVFNEHTRTSRLVTATCDLRVDLDTSAPQAQTWRNEQQEHRESKRDRERKHDRL